MSAYRNGSRIKFTFEINLDDVRRASTVLRNRNLAPTLGTAALFGAFVVGLLLWSVPTLLGAGLAVGVVGVTVWFVRVALSQALTTRVWQDGRRRIDVEATEEALEMSDADSGRRLGWDMLLHWMETETDFYIYRSAFEYHLIPKRELDPATQVALRHLLVTHLSENKTALRRAARLSWVPFVVLVCAWLLAAGAIVEAIGRGLR